jgi:hypothetical protein
LVEDQPNLLVYPRASIFAALKAPNECPLQCVIVVFELKRRAYDLARPRVTLAANQDLSAEWLENS